MKNPIRSWNDLREFGIDALTGEACGLSMRILCDINKRGINTINDFFGGNMSFTAGSNWNRDGVASILLPYSILPDLAAYCLLKTYSTVVHFKEGTIQGYYDSDMEYITQMSNPPYNAVVRTYQVHGTAKGGFRNEHMMSGRVE